MFTGVEPLPCGPCLVHSDLHPGNLLLDPEFHLLAVVDWEEAAISDIRVDIAQACLACDNRVSTSFKQCFAIIRNLYKTSSRSIQRIAVMITVEKYS